MAKKEKEKTEGKKYNKFGSLFWATKRLWKMDAFFILWSFLGVPVNVAIPLVVSFFPKILIDGVGAGKSFQELAGLTAAYLGVSLILNIVWQLVFDRCQSRRYYPTSIYQTEMAEFDGYTTDFENTEKQDYRKVVGYVAGDACQGNCAVEFFAQDVFKTLEHSAGFITYGALIAALNPVVFAVVAVTAVLSYFTTRWEAAYREKHKYQWEKEERKKSYLQGLSDDFANAKDIKLYGLEKFLDKMMRDYQTYILMWEKRCGLRGMWASMLAGVMSLVQNGVTYVVLLELLLTGGISVGDFVFYFGLVSGIAGFLQWIITDVAALSVRADKIAYYRELYDYPSRFNHGPGCELPKAPVRIEFQDVWYRYDGAEDDTLKGINLVIEEGESLALVGVNGAGKTTLIKLLCGMYAPTGGEILVGGKRIEEYNIEEYYSMISAVFQEICPVAFTMFEFVASADLERPTARQDAIEAMKSADIYEKIQGLSHGIDTHLMKGIYDDSVDLSGGEMQKLVLARAIYKNGSILVLDEPTAALDPIAENKLYLRYRELTKGKTSVYISHRFASTRFCDRIVLLEDGIIKESGTHEELMELGGSYAYMFGVQSKYYQEGEKHE